MKLKLNVTSISCCTARESAKNYKRVTYFLSSKVSSPVLVQNGLIHGNIFVLAWN